MAVVSAPPGPLTAAVSGTAVRLSQSLWCWFKRGFSGLIGPLESESLGEAWKSSVFKQLLREFS